MRWLLESSDKKHSRFGNDYLLILWKKGSFDKSYIRINSLLRRLSTKLVFRFIRVTISYIGPASELHKILWPAHLQDSNTTNVA